MKVVHLPCYYDNPYQSLLFNALQSRGIETIDGGGGGNFLRSILFRWKPDVVHFHWLHPYVVRSTLFKTFFRGFQFLFELCLLRLAGKRLIWTMHNEVSHNGKYLRTEQAFQWFAARIFHQVTLHSEYAKSVAVSQYNLRPGKILVYPHPNYLDYYPSSIDKQTARQKLSLPDDVLVFLFLGRLAAYKGLLELITTFKIIKGDHVRLLIAGNSTNKEEKQHLEQMVKADLRIQLCIRYIPDEEIQNFMEAADVVILPFRKILTSGSQVLAMGFGKPVIASRSGGFLEIMPDSYPLFFAPNEQNALELAMRKALRLQPELEDLGSRCLQVVNKFTWNEYASKLAVIYQYAD